MTDLTYRLNRLRCAVAAWRQTIAPNADPYISIKALEQAPLYLDDISAAIAAADSSPTLAQPIGWAVINRRVADRWGCRQRPYLFQNRLHAEYEATWEGDEVVPVGLLVAAPPTLAQTEDTDRVMDGMHDRIEWLLGRAGPTTQCDYLKRFPEDAEDDDVL